MESRGTLQNCVEKPAAGTVLSISLAGSREVLGEAEIDSC